MTLIQFEETAWVILLFRSIGVIAQAYFRHLESQTSSRDEWGGLVADERNLMETSHAVQASKSRRRKSIAAQMARTTDQAWSIDAN